MLSLEQVAEVQRLLKQRQRCTERPLGHRTIAAIAGCGKSTVSAIAKGAWAPKRGSLKGRLARCPACGARYTGAKCLACSIATGAKV